MKRNIFTLRHSAQIRSTIWNYQVEKSRVVMAYEKKRRARLALATSGPRMEEARETAAVIEP